MCDDTGTSTVLEGNAGSPTYYADGVEITGGGTPNRDDMHTALCTGTIVLATILGCDLSGANWDDMDIGAYTSAGFSWAGDLYEILIYNSTLSAADRGDVESWLIAKHGI